MAKLKDVELARKGSWKSRSGNAVSFGDKEFAQILRNFRQHNAPGAPQFTHAIPFVVSHDMIDVPNDQLPKEYARGFLTSIRQRGDFLVGDADDVPDETAEAMKQNRLLNVSVEILPKAPFPESEGPAIRRVSYLGATPPAMKGLNSRGLGCTVIACSEPGTVYRLDRDGEVWAFSEIEMLDRSAIIERLVAAGMSDALANSLADDQLRGLVSMDLGAFAASLKQAEEKEPMATPAEKPEASKDDAKKPNDGPVQEKKAEDKTFAFSETQLAQIVEKVAEKLTADLTKGPLANAKAAVEDLKVAAFSERVDAFIASELAAGRLTPAEVNGGPKTPSLKAKLLAQNAVSVEGFSESLAESTMSDIRSRPAKFTPKIASEDPKAVSEDPVLAFCEEHSEVLAVMEAPATGGKGRTPAQMAEWLKTLPADRQQAWQERVRAAKK